MHWVPAGASPPPSRDICWTVRQLQGALQIHPWLINRVTGFSHQSEMRLPQTLLGCWCITYFVDSDTAGRKRKGGPQRSPVRTFLPPVFLSFAPVSTVSQEWIVNVSFSNTIPVLGKEYDAMCSVIICLESQHSAGWGRRTVSLDYIGRACLSHLWERGGGVVLSLEVAAGQDGKGILAYVINIILAGKGPH